jgi:hypothetical protein
MKHRSRKLLAAAVAALLPVLAVTATHTGLATLQQDTTLRRAPDGAPAGFLPAGLDVEVLQERDGWLLVRLEGWVPAGAVTGSGDPDAAEAPSAAGTQATTAGIAADTTAAEAEAEPGNATGAMAAGASGMAAAVAAEPAPAPVAAGAIEGLVKLKTGRKKAKPASGLAVYLLPGDPGEDLLLYNAATAEQIAELKEEANKLKRQADRAMKEESFSIATRQHDDLMRKRARVLREMLALQAAEHGSHAAMAAARAQATVASSSVGWYTFSSLEPGTYTVYARLTNSDVDVEWVERVQVTTGVANVQLDNVNVRGLP